jgi:hypothetical protein
MPLKGEGIASVSLILYLCFHNFFDNTQDSDIRQPGGLTDERTEVENRDPLAFRPTLAGGLAFSDRFSYYAVPHQVSRQSSEKCTGFGKAFLSLMAFFTRREARVQGVAGR